MARRTFLSFHFTPDIWRVWNVRNSWVVRDNEQQADGFFDGSVFEASKRESPDSLKRFLREGLKNTSVTCVLAGKETSQRRWVRYEIVQSVLKGNGLLTVDINNVKNKAGETTIKGVDPLECIGLYRTSMGIYFAEIQNGKWEVYKDYTKPVEPADLWFDPPKNSNVVPLSTYCLRYDFIKQNGRENIGGWIETAAGIAGR